MSNIYLYKNKLWKEKYDFRYTGALESFQLDKGDYFILCDGARGGLGVGNHRPLAGRAMGILHLKQTSNLYAAVGGEGGQPDGRTPGKGGWNGGADGGKSFSNDYLSGRGGGGASDIRISDNQTVIKDPDIRTDIPVAYKQVKYVGSSKGDYSSYGVVYPTNYYPNSKTKIVAEMNLYSYKDGDVQQQWGCAFGCREGSSSTNQFAFWVHTTTFNNCQLAINGSGITDTDFIYDKRVTITMDKNSVTWTDGVTTKTLTSTDYSMTDAVKYSLDVLGSYNGSAHNGRTRGEIYSIKIYEDDTIVRDYVPVQKEGVSFDYGLYDVVTGHYTSYVGTTNDLIYKHFTTEIKQEMYSRIIVGAGAGGGKNVNPGDNDCFRGFHGSGGGVYGSMYWKNTNYATQNSGYAFGQGETPPTKIKASAYGAEGASGGGGGWFGGYGQTQINTEGYSSSPGGGGSSYVLTENSYKPEGYLPDDNYWFTDPFMDSGVAEYARIIVAEPVDLLHANDVVYAFCTGNIEQFPISNSMTIEVECYGGAGGVRCDSTDAAAGGYTRGVLKVYPEDEMYINVGGNGLGFNIGDEAYNKIFRPTLGYNGGGKPKLRNNSHTQNGGGGGGATDIRICESNPNIKIPESFKYVRMEIIGRRNEYDHGIDDQYSEFFQMSQLVFKDKNGEIPVKDINAYSNSKCDKDVVMFSGAATTEWCKSLIDGTTDTKFACVWDNYVNIIIEFENEVSSIESYYITTADDMPVRDPFAWRIYVSTNGTNWELLDSRFVPDLPETRLTVHEFNKETFKQIDPPTLHTRVLVAGGSGGSVVPTYNKMYGGGLEGGADPNNSVVSRRTGPGKQTPYNRSSSNSYGKSEAEGIFGYGGNGTLHTTSYGTRPGGGGGWFGGSGTVYNGTASAVASGCGGSGYVLTADSYKPEGYNVSERYYIQDGETILGGNTLPIEQTLCKITILETIPINILMKDKKGIKSFDVEDNKWKYLKSSDPELSDFTEYGVNTIVTDEGLEEDYEVLVCPTINEIDGKTLSIDKMNYSVIPKKQTIRHVAKTSMKPRSISFDADYNVDLTEIDVKTKREGVSDMAELTVDLQVLLKSENVKPKIYSTYIEAFLNLTGNRYIPKEVPEEEKPPIPKPGDPDYYEKDLLPVGRKNNIPKEYYDYLDKVEGNVVSTIHSAVAKCYDREIYIMTQLNNKVLRLVKFNTITKESKIIFETSSKLSRGPGDFEIFDDFVLYTDSSNYSSSSYPFYKYNLKDNTIQSTAFGTGSNYYLAAYGKIARLNDDEVVMITSYYLVIYNAKAHSIRNYAISSSRTSHTDFAIGNKYIAIVGSYQTMYLFNRETLEFTMVNLPDSTQTVITFYNDKFYIAKNSAVYIFNEDTLEIEKTYLTPWSNCRTINVISDIVYVTCDGSRRLWMYDINSTRYDSIYLSWALPSWETYYAYRPTTMNGTLWLPYWKLLNTSYIGLAKYNFGQKYGQYYIRYNADIEDEFEFDDRFVTFTDTYVTVHPGIISKETEPIENTNIKKIKMSKKEYYQLRNVSFDCSLIDEP